MNNLQESEKYKISINKNLEKYKKKMDIINKQINYLKLLSMSYDNDQNELPMPLEFNNITLNNFKKEKSKKYTKHLIDKLKNRKSKHKESNDKIKIKIEVQEEIEIPSLEYA
jgi:hypothetical protein